ncbi:MAG: flagellin [Comamonas sp.]
MALSTLANVSSLQAQQNLNKTQQALQSSVTRLSTGLRINADRPQGAETVTPVGNTSVPSTSVVLKISPEAMALSRTDAASSARAANELISNAQTAEGALGQVSALLQRAGELAYMSESGQLNADDQATVQTELASLSNEVNRIAQTTTGANGQKLLDGSYQGQSATVNGTRMSVSALSNVAELTGTRNGTLESSASIKKALEAVNNLRGSLSVSEQTSPTTAAVTTTSSVSRFSSQPNSLEVASAPATRGRVSGDIANETANLTRNQILLQAGNAILAQANQLPSTALSLLRG